ncbi:SDR family oxidoreductase [Methanospirillum sp. J.3.6.1-F.2.7.3]|uniref:SDR family oxidoreductase n=1 Tax=Methanospirillum purgamenti TaxID=2834276 RepID=A0A8E7B2D5_9EURY|nr:MULTISPECIES: SDR family oxidoreductase [Methanospirillum]MDX8549495.1 SDR family oxidoreductase [Methanospirillum hungatei]QVV89223.1 SDR family oxidoreductase [Methanospirillum sp. J.3.6.1-F.2.7.3]
MKINQQFSLKNHIILLTGASGYLGAAMTEAIINADANIIITGRHVDSLEKLKGSFPASLSDKCHIFPGDVTEVTFCHSIFLYIKQKFGSLNGIVNNAYAGRVGTIEMIIPEDFDRAVRYNIISPFMLFKELKPLLIEGVQISGSSSSVVNVASMYGCVSPDPSIYCNSGENNPIHYGASKAGLIQMTRYLACHMGSSNIRFNCISPGPFPNIEKECNIPNFYENLAKKVPMNRVGIPCEVAGPVVFLLSDAASYVNGINLPIDGGWTAW